MQRQPLARSHRLRLGRFSESGRIYLITTTTEQRTPFFQDLRAGRTVVRALHREQAAAETLCFVVMPDHLHWLMALRDDASLPQVMQRIKSVTAHRLQRVLGQRGRIWQTGYHDRALRREESVHDVARYVVANPLRAGLVRRLGDYPLWDAAWL